MPQFTNLDDLSKWLNTQAGQQTMTTSGKSIEQILKKEATRLKSCIEKRLDEYYDSYFPSVYSRTNNLRYSMSVDDFVNINMVEGKATVTIDFDKYAIAAHSVFGNDSSNYNKVELINNGWQVRDGLWFSDIEHLGYQKPARFIENGIADFNKNNPYNLKIEVKGMFNS
mgnify:CR=1 FL=1